MTLHAFVLLPHNDESILKIGEHESDFVEFIKGIHSVIKHVQSQQDTSLYYDDENIAIFLQKCSEIIDESYLQKPENILRQTLGRTARNLKVHKRRESDCIYLQWMLDDLSVQLANDILSEIAERCDLYPEETYLLLNFANALSTENEFVSVFKDAKHLRHLPGQFIQIPHVTEQDELEIWLVTNHQLAFSLLDKIRFQRTSYVQQGKPIFREIDTGHLWYLDNFHKDHYEVFNAQRQHIGIADLQGKIDSSKKISGRTISE